MSWLHCLYGAIPKCNVPSKELMGNWSYLCFLGLAHIILSWWRQAYRSKNKIKKWWLRCTLCRLSQVIDLPSLFSTIRFPILVDSNLHRFRILCKGRNQNHSIVSLITNIIKSIWYFIFFSYKGKWWIQLICVKIIF